MLVQSIKRVL